VKKIVIKYIVEEKENIFNGIKRALKNIKLGSNIENKRKKLREKGVRMS
jgi:hypothetical protein